MHVASLEHALTRVHTHGPEPLTVQCSVDVRLKAVNAAGHELRLRVVPLVRHVHLLTAALHRVGVEVRATDRHRVDDESIRELERGDGTERHVTVRLIVEHDTVLDRGANQGGHDINMTQVLLEDRTDDLLSMANQVIDLLLRRASHREARVLLEERGPTQALRDSLEVIAVTSGQALIVASLGETSEHVAHGVTACTEAEAGAGTLDDARTNRVVQRAALEVSIVHAGTTQVSAGTAVGDDGRAPDVNLTLDFPRQSALEEVHLLGETLVAVEQGHEHDHGADHVHASQSGAGARLLDLTHHEVCLGERHTPLVHGVDLVLDDTVVDLVVLGDVEPVALAQDVLDDAEDLRIVEIRRLRNRGVGDKLHQLVALLATQFTGVDLDTTTVVLRAMRLVVHAPATSICVLGDEAVVLVRALLVVTAVLGLTVPLESHVRVVVERQRNIGAQLHHVTTHVLRATATNRRCPDILHEVRRRRLEL